MRKRVTALLFAILLMVVTQTSAYGTEERDYITVLDTVEATIPLEGELVENLQIISVVMPTAVDIVVRIHDDGKFRQLYAPSNLSVTSSSDMPVNLSLVEVKDESGKLRTFDAILNTYSMDGRNTLLYDGSRTPLAAGACDILLGRLESLSDDGIIVPSNQLRLAMDGRAAAANGVVGGKGDTFAFATTLKVAAAPGG